MRRQNWRRTPDAARIVNSKIHRSSGSRKITATDTNVPATRMCDIFVVRERTGRLGANRHGGGVAARRARITRAWRARAAHSGVSPAEAHDNVTKIFSATLL
jgi:hypothetical protein